jgi:hypothetical protein
MTAVSIKKQLIKQISSIEDITTLKSIKMILKEVVEPKKLNPEQKKLIAQAEEEYKKGEVIEHSDLMTKIAAKYGW